VTLPDDHELSGRLAGEAGDLLLALRERGGEPAALRADGDRQSHEFLAAELARLRPGDAVLSEEGKDDRARLSADRVWIVDPLDGTREFGEAGRTDWAVHVALWQGGDLVAGAVALPAQGRKVLTTMSPPGGAGGIGGSSPLGSTASPPARPQPPGSGQPLRLLVSRSRPPEFVQLMADKLGAELVPLGSAGAKAAAVICGEAEGYVHAGGQYEWDSAAPVAVARAAGLHASRIDGSKLAYNQASPSLPDILICQAEIAPLLLETIGSVLLGGTPG
jgi:3'(2'), 5'-bisphosphate nucleotidase